MTFFILVSAAALLIHSPAGGISATRPSEPALVLRSGSTASARFPARTPAPPIVADSVVVAKRPHTLTLYQRGEAVRVYLVALGGNPVGDKIKVGDKRTPEGLYHIAAHNPASLYHLSLRIDYPDAAHRASASARGVDPGGDIMIHGLPPKYASVGSAHRQYDWTNGCIAVTDQEIEEIWREVPDGTPIRINP